MGSSVARSLGLIDDISVKMVENSGSQQIHPSRNSGVRAALGGMMRSLRHVTSLTVVAVAGGAGIWLISTTPTLYGQSSPPDVSVSEFDKLMTELSNWGRWGKDDQKGEVHLITPDKR